MKKIKIKRYESTFGSYQYCSSIEINKDYENELHPTTTIEVYADTKKETEELSKHLAKATREFYKLNPLIC